jgi:hypothetical protein
VSILELYQNRPSLTYVKSPSFTNDFVFFSNILPVSFEQATQKIPAYHFSADYYVSHNTFNAVDNDPNTCWRTHRPINVGEFFAIDFLQVQTNITFELTVAHSFELQHGLIVSVSLNGRWWISYRSIKGIYTQHNRNSHRNIHKMLFDTAQFNLGFESFRYIAFNMSKNSSEHFHVCDVRLIRKCCESQQAKAVK